MPAVDFDLTCSRCGTNLRGVELSETCPKCGRLVGQTLNLAVIDTASMTVNSDVACINCQYNLRTLSINSVCPECGKPVCTSLRPEDLQFADPAWLKRVRLGLTLALWACACKLVVGICSYAGFLSYTSLASTILHWAYLFFACLWCPGLYLAVSPPPSTFPQSRERRLATWARWAALASLTFLLSQTAFLYGWQLWLYGRLSQGPSFAFGIFGLTERAVYYLLGCLMYIAYYAGLVILLIVMRGLARRCRQRMRLHAFVIWFAAFVGAIDTLWWISMLLLNITRHLGATASTTGWFTGFISTVIMSYRRSGILFIVYVSEFLVLVCLMRSRRLVRAAIKDHS